MIVMMMMMMMMVVMMMMMMIVCFSPMSNPRGKCSTPGCLPLCSADTNSSVCLPFVFLRCLFLLHLLMSRSGFFNFFSTCFGC